METIDENNLSPEQRAALVTMGIIKEDTPVVVNHDAEAVPVPPAQDAEFKGDDHVPPVSVSDLSAHLDVRELTDEQRDNKIQELEARIQALEVLCDTALQNLTAYVNEKLGDIAVAGSSDIDKAVAYVKTLIHPSQWEKL